MKTKTFLTLSTLVLLSSCNTEPTHDVQYYLDHPQERKAKLEECKNNPGELMNTPNCKNADQAELKAMFQGTEMPKVKVPDKW